MKAEEAKKLTEASKEIGQIINVIKSKLFINIKFNAEHGVGSITLDLENQDYDIISIPIPTDWWEHKIIPRLLVELGNLGYVVTSKDKNNFAVNWE